MTYLLFFFVVCFVLGLVGVAANPAPYYGVVGLVVGVVGGCGLLLSLGASFIGVILLLIYLGGMLVVFAYSVALASEPYPEAWGSGVTLAHSFVYFLMALAVGAAFVGGLEFWGCGGADGSGVFSLRSDFCGVMVLFSDAGGMLLLCVWGLLLTLFVVFELVRGLSYSGLRLP